MVKNKKIRLKYSIIRFAPLILVAYFIIEAFAAFQQEDKNAVITRNRDYIKDITNAMADKLDDIFMNSLKSIEAIAKLSSNDLRDGELNTVYLAELEKIVQFDHLQFTDKDGVMLTSNGKKIKSDNKWFYTDGMKGNSGIFVVMPTKTSMAMVVFYAPIISKENVVGVLSSTFDENTIKRLLEYKVYGANASAGIVNTEGRTVIPLISFDLKQSAIQGLFRDNFKSVLYTSMFDAENRNKVINAYTTLSPTNFKFNGAIDDIQGYMAPLHTVPLNVYSIFPSEAAQSLYSMGIQAGRTLQFLLILIFFGYIAYLLFVQFLMMRSEARQNRIAGYIAKAENAIAKAIVLVDAEKQTFQDFSSIPLPIPKQGTIDDMRTGFIKTLDDQQNGQDFKYFFDDIIKGRRVPKDIPSVVFSGPGPRDETQYITMVYIPVEFKKDIVQKGVILFRNITAEKSKEIEANRRLSLALSSAREANNAKTAFLFNMSHDIRTPMNAVTGFTAMAKKHIDNPEMVNRYLDKIDIAGHQLLSLVNQVLEMSRIESGKIILSEQKCDLESLIMALSTTYGSHAESKGITFVATISNVDHKYVCIDCDRVNQIAANIIGNAIKYTNEGGSITCSLKELPCDREGYSNYALTVEDTGIGMSPDFLDHIFDEFARESSTTVSRIQGTGLGMTIVKKLTELMGGTIKIESEKGKGTKITVFIPMKWCDDFKQEDPVENESTSTSLKGMRVLLVDDNEMNREIAEEILIERGVVVDSANDGDVAVEKVCKASPGTYELLLMDIQMPRMNGYDATRAIRCLPDPRKANIPIVAMTANAFEEDRKNALLAGMDGHLAKPIDYEKLIQTLTKFRAK